MKTMALRTEIGLDGKLHLDLLCGLRPGPAEVVVVIQPVRSDAEPPYDTLEGVFAGLLPEDVDLDADLNEMNRTWQESLENS